MSTEKYPCRHPETAFRPVGDDGGLVVLPGRAEVKVLNPVGIKIFGLLDGKHTVEQIAGLVTEEFDVDESQALEDIRGFVGELAEHGMLAGSGDEPKKKEPE